MTPETFVTDEIFIEQEDGLYISQLKDFFLRNNYSFQTKAISGWELVANFANLGIGVGFFPDYLASDTRLPNLTLHPIKLPPFEYEIAAIYNKTTKLSRAANAVIEQFILE